MYCVGVKMKLKHKAPPLNSFLKQEYPDDLPWMAFFKLWLDARGYDYKSQDVGIVDGAKDAGIDAIAFAPNDSKHMAPVVVQSKKYNGEIPEKSLNQFIKTVELFRKGNNKDFKIWIDKHVRESLRANYQKLWNRRTEVEFVLVTSGRLKETDRKQLKSLKVNIQDKKKINSLLVDMSEGKTPRPEQIKIKYSSCSRNVHKNDEHKLHIITALLSDFAEEYRRHEDNLFAGNVRLALSGSNPVKKGIKDTIEDSPEEFAYYHNGITIVCKKVSFSTGSRVLLESPSIVNGAQTVTFLGRTMYGNIPKEANVIVKVIEVMDEVKFTRFETEIAMSSNTQNSVKLSDLSVVNPDLVSLERFFSSNKWFLQRKRGKFPQGNPKGKITKVELLQCFSCVDYKTGPSSTKDTQKLFQYHSSRLFGDYTKSASAKKDALLIAQLNMILKRAIGNYKTGGKSGKRRVGLAKFSALAIFIEALRRKKVWNLARTRLVEDGINKKNYINNLLEEIALNSLKSTLSYSKTHANKNELTAYFKNKEQVQKMVKIVTPRVMRKIIKNDFHHYEEE